MDPTPLYIRKQRELAIYDESFGKLYVIEIKSVIAFPARSHEKTRGRENEGKSHYVIENKLEKMSETGHAIICMKTHNIEAARHYMYERTDG